MAETGKKDYIDELKAMRERMDELCVRNLNLGKGLEYQPQSLGDWVPKSDIVDSDKELVYLLDLPGVKDHDLHVECKANRLWISGLRNEDLPEGRIIRVERSSGKFSRVFKFPCPVREDGIRAEFKKGVLAISVPKSSPECRPHRIEVREVK